MKPVLKSTFKRSKKLSNCQTSFQTNLQSLKQTFKRSNRLSNQPSSFQTNFQTKLLNQLSNQPSTFQTNFQTVKQTFKPTFNLSNKLPNFQTNFQTNIQTFKPTGSSKWPLGSMGSLADYPASHLILRPVYGVFYGDQCMSNQSAFETLCAGCQSVIMHETQKRHWSPYSRLRLQRN